VAVHPGLGGDPHRLLRGIDRRLPARRPGPDVSAHARPGPGAGGPVVGCHGRRTAVATGVGRRAGGLGRGPPARPVAPRPGAAEGGRLRARQRRRDRGLHRGRRAGSPRCGGSGRQCGAVRGRALRPRRLAVRAAGAPSARLGGCLGVCPGAGPDRHGGRRRLAGLVRHCAVGHDAGARCHGGGAARDLGAVRRAARDLAAEGALQCAARGGHGGDRGRRGRAAAGVGAAGGRPPALARPRS
jgi:hypothetical protein